MSSKFTLNYGLRIEHEDGMREVNNNFTVGFDPTATSALSSVTIPGNIDPTGGTPARTVTGGLMFAGVDGNNDLPGQSAGGEMVAARRRRLLAQLRRPCCAAATGCTGRRGTTRCRAARPATTARSASRRTRVSPQTAGTPTVTLTNPFPSGLVAPLGNAPGALSGVGTTISYVDQNRTAPRVQQYSVDLQRELPGAMAITVSYVGARGDHLPLGGTVDTVVNINQLDPKYLALGAAVLNQTVPNPFFGNAAAGPLSTQANADARAAAAAVPAVPERQGLGRCRKASTATTPASSSGASGRRTAASAAASATPTAC